MDNDYIGRRIEQMREGVERGESVLRTAVAAGVFTNVVLQMIAVGDETGELDSLLAAEGDEDPYALHRELQRTMQRNVGIYRNETGLRAALDAIEELKRRAPREGEEVN